MSALSSPPHTGHTSASSSHTEDSESVRPIAATTHSASKFVVPLHKEDLEVEKAHEEECASTTESQRPPATSLLDPALHPKTVNDTSAEPSAEESGGHHHHHADLWREGGEGSRTPRRATHDVVEDEACQGAEASGHGTGGGLPGSPSPLGTSFTGLDSGHGTPLRSAPSSECHSQSNDSISLRFRVQDSDAGDAEVFRGIPSRQHREIPHPPPPEGLQAAKITRTAAALPDSGSVSLSENAGGKSKTFTEVPRSSPHIPGAAAPSAVAAPSIWDSNNGKHLGMSATMTPFHLLSSNAANTALQRVSSVFVTGVSASTHGSERVSAIQTPTSTTPLRATPTAMTTAPASGAYAVASGSSAVPSPARTTTAPKRVETEPGAVGSSTSRNSSPTTANPHPSLPRHSRTSSGKCSVSSPSGASPRSTAALPAYQQYYCLACHTAGLSLLDFLTGAHVQHQGLSVEEALLFTPSVLLHELQQGIERYYEQRAAPSGGTTRGRSTSAAGGVSPSGRSSSRPQRQLSGGRHYHPNEEFWREAPAARENAGGDEALLFGVSKAEREIMKQRAKEELRELLQWQSKIQRRMEEQRCLLHLLRCEDKRQEAAQQRWKKRRREAFKAQLRRLQRAAEGLQKLMEDRLEMTRQQQQHQKQQQDSRSRSLKCHVSEDPSSLPGRASTGEHHQSPTSSDVKNAAGRPFTPTPNAPRSPNFTTSPDHSSFHAHIRQHWNSQEELERVQKQVQEELEALEAQEEEEQLAAAEATGGDADESGKEEEEEEEEEEERFNAARKAIYQHRDSTSSSQLDPPPSSRHALRQKPAKEPPLPHPQRKCRATTAQGWKPEWLDAPQSPPQKSKLQQGTASSGAPNALRSLHVTHLHHHLEKGRFAMKKGTTAEPHSLSSEDSTAAVSSSKEKNSDAVASEVASVKSATSSRGSTSFRSDQEDDDEEDVRSLFDEEKDGTEGGSRAARLFSAAPRPHGSAPSRSQRVPPRPPLLSHPRSPTSFTSPRAVLPHTTVAPQPSPPTKRSNVRAERCARDHHDEPEGVAASKKTASGTRRGAGPISPSSDTTAHPALPCGDCSSRERRRRGLRQQAEEDARQLEEELQRLCDEAEAAQRGLDDGPLPDSSDPTTGLYVYRHHAEHLNPNNLILNSCHAEMRRKRAAAVAAAVAAASSRYPASTRTPLSPRRVSYSSGGGDASPTTTAARSTTTNTGGSQGHWRLPKQAGLLVAPSSAFSFTNSSQLSPSASQVSHNSSSTSSSRSSRPLSDNDNDRLGSSCSRSRSSGSSSSGNHTTESATWKAGSGTGEADPPQTKRENPHSHRDRGGLQKHLPAPHSAAQTDSNSNQPSKSHHHHRSAIAPQLDGISKVNSSRRRYHSSASGVATPIMTRTRAGRTQASGKGNAERGESILRTGTDLPPHSGGDEPAVAAMVSPRCRRRCHEKPPQEPHRRHAHKGAVLEPGGLSGGNVKDEEEMEGPDAVLSGLTLSQRAQYVAAAAGERGHRHHHQRPTAFSAQTSSHRTNASFSNDPVDKGNEELEAADEEDALVGEEESLARSGQRLRRKTTISLSSNLLPPSSASSSRPESHYQYGSRSDNLTASLPPTGAHPLSARKTKPQRHGTAGLPSSSTVAGSMHYPPPPAPVPVSSSVDRNVHTEPSDANDVAGAHNTTAAMKEEGVPHDENLRPLPPADLPHVTSPNAAEAGDSWQGVVATMGTSARSELET